MKNLRYRLIFLIVVGFIAIVASFLLVLPKLGEMQVLTNRMLKDYEVRKLLKKTQEELIVSGANVRPLAMHLNNAKVGDVYRGSTGRILLVDRLNQFGVWMEPRVSSGEVSWQCSTAFASFKISLDCVELGL